MPKTVRARRSAKLRRGTIATTVVSCLVLAAGMQAPLALADGVTNLISNGDFDSGISPWQKQGTHLSLESSDDTAAGGKSMFVSNRQAHWNGPLVAINEALNHEGSYTLTGSAKNAGETEMTLVPAIGSGAWNLQNLSTAATILPPGEWTDFSLSFSPRDATDYSADMAYTNLGFVTTGSEAVGGFVNSFYLDDITLVDDNEIIDTRRLNEDNQVLWLNFEESLIDDSPAARNVSLWAGDESVVPTESYDLGVREGTSSFSFDGQTGIDLGTSADLQPEDLTVSFWFSPTQVMQGEQLFAWHKASWNTDGWYLGSPNDERPLELSVGASTGQPYKVSATGISRSEFFPVDEWTHVVVAYDSETKDVAIYRNGVRVETAIDYSISNDSPGTIVGEDASTKVIGFNGTIHKGSYLNGLLDDYRIYSEVANISDVVSIYGENRDDFDPVSVAQQDLDALGVPASASNDFALATLGKLGSEISWRSSGAGIEIVEGPLNAKVNRGTIDRKVVLTATAKYGDMLGVSKTFEVTIPATGEGPARVAMDPVNEIELDDSYMVNAEQNTIDYILSLSSAKFLYPFYKTAGLPTPTEDHYTSWESPNPGWRFTGHFFGHRLSALSKGYYGGITAEEQTKVIDELKIAVNGLKETQGVFASADPQNAGYLPAFPVNCLPTGCAAVTGGADNLLVPFYNLHKVEAGLIDVYTYMYDIDRDLALEALEVASDFGLFIKNWAERQSNPASILNTEYGGMNEALYNLYQITGDPDHKRAAEYFDEVSLFRDLAAGKDVLNGKHANTTIPKLIGAITRYRTFTERDDLAEQLTQEEKDELEMYRSAAENFWQIVVDHHTFANGGNSRGEHFREPDSLYTQGTTGDGQSNYLSNGTSEGCNEYNMLKLTRELFELTHDKKYADYYESTFINSVLSTQNPETGMMTYFQPMTVGYAKAFGTPEGEFWCDHGTNIESFTRLKDSIYFRAEGDVYINMFRSSVFEDREHGLQLSVVADVPYSPTVSIAVDALDGAIEPGTNLKLRIPDWVVGTPELTVNGETQDVEALTQDGYVVIPAVAGDQLTYTLNAEVTLHEDTENPNWVAFHYGPVLLAASVGPIGDNPTYKHNVNVTMSRKDQTLEDTLGVTDIAAWKAGVKDNIVRTDDAECVACEVAGAVSSKSSSLRFEVKNTESMYDNLVLEPYYSLYDARYGIYWTLEEAEVQSPEQEILKAKQALRDKELKVDEFFEFDDSNAEAGRGYKKNNSTTGTYNGRKYRDGSVKSTDTFFQWEIAVRPGVDNYLGVDYTGADSGRTFDVYVNDVLLKHETIADADGFYTQWDLIPAEILNDIEVNDSYRKGPDGEYLLDGAGNKIPAVTVRFQGDGTSFVGGVYGIRVQTAVEYSDVAKLTVLESSEGVITPTLEDGTTEYTLTVPEGTQETLLTLSPAVPSGLVYVNGTLIDDTEPFKVSFASDSGLIDVTTCAQDHQTCVAYQIIHMEETDPAVPAEKVAVLFSANGGVGQMRGIEAERGETVVLPENEFTRAGYSFVGWSTSADGKEEVLAAGARFMVPDEDNLTAVTLYAQWQQDQGSDLGEETPGEPGGKDDNPAGSGDSATDENLAKSGSTAAGLLVGAIALLVAGGAFIVIRRRYV
ncbi:hypothetical protein FYJ24_06175 [Actinomycetaceae bacterium WB03_NA08]|uniref:Uncharacterized protein n=1 Tax=Scrofimicrobium canadense TaxID=2652290 RepID=A0A6N7W7W7_9ACTO|nr:beta-L-arabinofuranosidase domain-containing protein [Scrofimicrobium canadense]MSS84356.1 hypothetical protein [Scrofimicrobium canadense]